MKHSVFQYAIFYPFLLQEQGLFALSLEGDFAYSLLQGRVQMCKRM